MNRRTYHLPEPIVGHVALLVWPLPRKSREEFEPARSTLVGDPRTVCVECDEGEQKIN
jgi:hypothetical protein